MSISIIVVKHPNFGPARKEILVALTEVIVNFSSLPETVSSVWVMSSRGATNLPIIRAAEMEPKRYPISVATIAMSRLIMPPEYVVVGKNKEADYYR